MNAATVEDFFNQALSHLVPDPISTPPVLNVNMEGHGRFAFVELRDRHLANQALLMDKIVEIHGRFIHIGRPKGFIENFEPAADQTKMPELGITPVMDKRPTRALLLSNLLRIIDVRGDREREEVCHLLIISYGITIVLAAGNFCSVCKQVVVANQEIMVVPCVYTDAVENRG